MKHLGLFEGIGGFSLAAHWMGWETVAVVGENVTGITDLEDGKIFESILLDLQSENYKVQPFSKISLNQV
ncbi:MAG: hypothetical protein AAF806_18335 [Bacteroidota bacterium]